MADLSARLAKLNPFAGKRRGGDEYEDYGEEIDSSTVAGGGHSARRTEVTEHELRVSHALRAFLCSKGLLSEEDAASDEPTEALRALLDKPHISVPPELTDRSHPFPEYFISSSHNTYLIAHQLFGNSAASAYETALRTGSRCVEIDAWDNDDDKDEPKVTHGYTLVSHIPFRAVCETIRDVMDVEAAQAINAQGYRAAPILISLENHCGHHGQIRLVEIMREVWGDRLLSKAIREKGHDEQQGGEHVTLEELGSKIVVIVEYHIPGEVESDSDSSSSDEEDEEEEKEARKAYKQKKKAAKDAIIIPELAELGVYAQSVKPTNNSWFDPGELKSGPHHHLINVSESGLASSIPTFGDKIGRHNAQHLMRVFPKGTRISSENLHPVPFWGVGAQICALNWQHFGTAMQLNEALFSGTDGYVLKPAALRSGGDGKLNTGKRTRLLLRVAGATGVPVHGDHKEDEIKPYLTCILMHPHTVGGDHPKRKTEPYKQHKLTGFLHSGENPLPSEPVWDETLEWEYDDNELVFLRLLIKSDEAWATNPMFAVATVRLMYVVPGWSFIRMLDLKGRETTCTLLVKFEVEEV
ncbi:putative 1-phosphatidylinositol- -bisphosphate phosphodiesterase delta-3 protein [Phaeoacremonium minimum UCRPA7]|uniref:Phosphoinositide phospholipase C n=1 Tax=Phaeoacremonium minimum (strain UCR-PA7) TaxID=1286976 RepID=R8BVG2_PHAM7|nr:putative 1-phosphatidylinositol- -bisphosphate phosphodiesterase delta-3 protein [Phaeoacremonium minimum UCRPA7]EOO03320.1 putative 1-phosphatidylinositol- -bisphosphate phosphodiesterase delta-3 protein [Phaeoacremonium minimum UCRPA7]